ncbi:MAG: hypothetical protein ACI4DS_02310 [Eubacterium sp.]
MKSNFVKCGITGLCIEIVWTGIGNLIKKDKKMIGHTSIIMFPIYGMASLIKPLHTIIRKENIIIRGSIYTALIFATEYITGTYLKSKNICPWDYSKSKHNINGVIRLDYAPAWFTVGLIYEHMLDPHVNKEK